MDDLIYIGGNFIKSFNDETGEIGSNSIVFGHDKAKDFHGNWFTKNTNTGFFTNGIKEDVGLINHRVPLFKKGQFDSETEKALKKISDITFKNPVKTTIDDVGQFSKLVLDLSDKYEKMVYDLVKKGAFKWSAGAAPQTYKALPTGELEMFVTAERSLTPIPAEYRMLEHRIMPLKAYTDFLKLDNSNKGVKKMNNNFLAGNKRNSDFLKAMEGSPEEEANETPDDEMTEDKITTMMDGKGIGYNHLTGKKGTSKRKAQLIALAKEHGLSLG